MLREKFVDEVDGKALIKGLYRLYRRIYMDYETVTVTGVDSQIPCLVQ